MNSQPNKESEDIGKDYLDRITKNYENGQTGPSHIKPAPNYNNPCVDSQETYVSSTIPYFTIAYGT